MSLPDSCVDWHRKEVYKGRGTLHSCQRMRGFWESPFPCLCAQPACGATHRSWLCKGWYQSSENASKPRFREESYGGSAAPIPRPRSFMVITTTSIELHAFHVLSTRPNFQNIPSPSGINIPQIRLFVYIAKYQERRGSWINVNLPNLTANIKFVLEILGARATSVVSRSLRAGV